MAAKKKTTKKKTTKTQESLIDKRIRELIVNELLNSDYVNDALSDSDLLYATLEELVEEVLNSPAGKNIMRNAILDYLKNSDFDDDLYNIINNNDIISDYLQKVLKEKLK